MKWEKRYTGHGMAHRYEMTVGNLTLWLHPPGAPAYTPPLSRTPLWYAEIWENAYGAQVSGRLLDKTWIEGGSPEEAKEMALQALEKYVSGQIEYWTGQQEALIAGKEET